MTYTISEFRARMRECFNAAEQGEEIAVERFGKTFVLVEKKSLLFTAPTINEYQHSKLHEASKTTVVQVPLETIVAKTKGSNACEHGYAPGLCKKASCNRKNNK